MCLFIASLCLTSCGSDEPQPRDPVTPPPPKPPVRRRTAREMTGILLPASARYERFAEEKPTPTRKGTRLLARFDLPATDLDKLAADNPHLPDVAALSEQKDLLASLTGLQTDVAWWNPRTLARPRCAWRQHVTLPVRPVVTKDADADPKSVDDAAKTVEPPVDATPDTRLWTVTMCVGEITGGRFRVHILFVEELAKSDVDTGATTAY